MRTLVRIDVAGARPLRAGHEFWWTTILAATAEKPTFTYAEIDGASDPYNEKHLGMFLRKLEDAGYIERVSPGSERTFRVAKRQRHCPVISEDRRESRVGIRQTNMWNVMRRRRGGFTIEDLVIDASTDEASVAHNTAKQYCLLLERAGVLKKQRTGERGVGRNIYVLLGSANTGPKPPRRMMAKLVYDPNRNVVLGDVIAEEERP